MSHQEISFDDGVFVFETVMRVRNTEIDIGQHMTIEAMTAALSEVRARFFYSKGIKEINADFQGLIVDSLELTVFSRVRVREEILFEVGISQLNDNDGMIAFKATRMYDGSLVARANMHFVNYDYRINKNINFNSAIKDALYQSPFAG